jgi:hypothetical protein
MALGVSMAVASLCDGAMQANLQQRPSILPAARFFYR